MAASLGKSGTTRPPTIEFFNVFCGLMAISELIWPVIGVYYIIFELLNVIGSEGRPDPLSVLVYVRIAIVFLVLLSFVLLAAFSIAPFLPRKREIWLYDLVLIWLGISSIIMIPLCLPLLWRWHDPTTKEYFGFPPAQVS